MKCFLSVAIIWAYCHLASTQIVVSKLKESTDFPKKLICYYDMASENRKGEHLEDFAQLLQTTVELGNFHNYKPKLFTFETVEVLRFHYWLERSLGVFKVFSYDIFRCDGPAPNERYDPVKFNENDLETAAQLCTHIIYGFLDIRPDNFQVQSLFTGQLRQLMAVRKLRAKYPQVKFLLSIGGDKEGEKPEKYLQLLESEKTKQKQFIDSALEMVTKYDFNGLDLAYQLPKEKALKAHSEIGKAIKSVKKVFTGDSVVDPKAHEHKIQFTELIKGLSDYLRGRGLLFSLTILPTVNAKAYYNVMEISKLVDFVTLLAFDFYTPQRNPKEADYASPIYPPPPKGNRKEDYNIDAQVNVWMTERFPRRMLNIAIAAYGRSWKMSKKSGRTGLPIVTDMNGPAEGGPITQTPGLLSYTEICQRLPIRNNPGQRRNSADTLTTGYELHSKFNNYAYAPPNPKTSEDGIWISFEDPDSVNMKTSYVNSRNLGGVALYDLSLDDFSGKCTSAKFPLLNAMKRTLF